MNQDQRIIDPLEVGEALRVSLSSAFDAIPNCSSRPTDIAKTLKASRVMVSRTISAIRKKSPTELLVSIPGPESLKSIMYAAKVVGTDPGVVQEALDAIEDFQSLLKGTYGTRAAFNAAIGVNQTKAKEKFEQNSRYQVYKGMSQILGVQCQKWAAGVILSPSPKNKEDVILSSFSGSLGMRRIRPDMPALLEYSIPVKQKTSDKQIEELPPLDLTPYCMNPQAVMKEYRYNGRSIVTFYPEDAQGKEALYDMCEGARVVVEKYHQIKNGYGKRGRSIMPALPTASLVSDIMVHKEVCSELNIDLKVYTTLSKGIAVMGDESRENDIVKTQDRYQLSGCGVGHLGFEEMPKYPQMIQDICKESGHSSDDFRVYRLEVQYPLYGFQYLAEFELIK